MKQWECCGKMFKPKKQEQVQAENGLQMLLQIVGAGIYSSICDAAECQDYAQYQCDEFDRARKGE